MPDKLWAPEEIEMLRKLWSDGFRVRIISDRIGRSKSSIWRQRRALGLPPRGVERVPLPEPPRSPRARPVGKGSTLPPLASLQGRRE